MAAEQGHQLLRVSGNMDDLIAVGCARHQGEARLGQAPQLGQELDDGLVGLAGFRDRGHRDLESPAAGGGIREAGNGVLRAARGGAQRHPYAVCDRREGRRAQATGNPPSAPKVWAE